MENMSWFELIITNLYCVEAHSNRQCTSQPWEGHRKAKTCSSVIQSSDKQGKMLQCECINALRNIIWNVNWSNGACWTECAIKHALALVTLWIHSHSQNCSYNYRKYLFLKSCFSYSKCCGFFNGKRLMWRWEKTDFKVLYRIFICPRLIYDQIPAKVIPISLRFTLCLLLINKCEHANILNEDS